MTRRDDSSSGGDDDDDVAIDVETVAMYRSDGAVCIRNAIGRKWIEAIERVRRSTHFEVQPTVLLGYCYLVGDWRIFIPLAIN